MHTKSFPFQLPTGKKSTRAKEQIVNMREMETKKNREAGMAEKRKKGDGEWANM